MNTTTPGLPRRGFSLIEMLVAIVTMSLIAAVAAALLMAITRSSEGINSSWQQQRTLARLGEQFRHDVRAASQVQTEGTLKFTFGANNACEYRRTDDGLERIATAPSGDVLQRELYRLPQQVECVWSATATTPPQVTLRLTEKIAAPPAVHWLASFVAVLHSDQRFTPNQQEE